MGNDKGAQAKPFSYEPMGPTCSQQASPIGCFHFCNQHIVATQQTLVNCPCEQIRYKRYQQINPNGKHKPACNNTDVLPALELFSHEINCWKPFFSFSCLYAIVPD